MKMISLWEGCRSESTSFRDWRVNINCWGGGGGVTKNSGGGDWFKGVRVGIVRDWS